jgi:hypothetical protein
MCVVPQGMEEGTELLIEGREFGLVTGRAAEFRFFSSSVRSGDTPGQILPNAERDLEDTGLLEVEIPALGDVPVGQVVPVRMNPVITELGILELWMKHTNSNRRWKVEFLATLDHVGTHVDAFRATTRRHQQAVIRK